MFIQDPKFSNLLLAIGKVERGLARIIHLDDQSLSCAEPKPIDFVNIARTNTYLSIVGVTTYVNIEDPIGGDSREQLDQGIVSFVPGGCQYSITVPQSATLVIWEHHQDF